MKDKQTPPQKSSHEAIEQQPLVSASLDDFTSTVVHDLQAPLRSLTMFTELLAQEYQDELDEKGQQYLDRISHSGLRMQTLVEDLLAFSRAGVGEQTWMKVDLNQTIELVKADLQSAIASTAAQITVNKLPQILINPKDIHQLFQNLIENALKFCDRAPEISISVVAQGEEWLFTVEDNGIGIAPEFQSEIFEIFKRLYPADIYPGSGMGLAICQKIITRYDGTIWVESVVGKGSTFNFTIPINLCPQSPTAKIV
ncbi:MAG: ATP-binding protein [Cyanobacteria bacterium J06588_4]